MSVNAKRADLLLKPVSLTSNRSKRGFDAFCTKLTAYATTNNEKYNHLFIMNTSLSVI